MELFINKGWLYMPIHILGWLLTIGAIATDIWLFLAIDRNSHSASDTLIDFLPYFASVWVVFSYFASNTSTKKND